MYVISEWERFKAGRAAADSLASMTDRATEQPNLDTLTFNVCKQLDVYINYLGSLLRKSPGGRQHLEMPQGFGDRESLMQMHGTPKGYNFAHGADAPDGGPTALGMPERVEAIDRAISFMHGLRNSFKLLTMSRGAPKASTLRHLSTQIALVSDSIDHLWQVIEPGSREPIGRIRSWVLTLRDTSMPALLGHFQTGGKYGRSEYKGGFENEPIFGRPRLPRASNAGPLD